MTLIFSFFSSLALLAFKIHLATVKKVTTSWSFSANFVKASGSWLRLVTRNLSPSQNFVPRFFHLAPRSPRLRHQKVEVKRVLEHSPSHDAAEKGAFLSWRNGLDKYTAPRGSGEGFRPWKTSCSDNSRGWLFTSSTSSPVGRKSVKVPIKAFKETQLWAAMCFHKHCVHENAVRFHSYVAARYCSGKRSTGWKLCQLRECFPNEQIILGETFLLRSLL